MTTTSWLLLGAGVAGVWYVSEQKKIALAGNKAVAGATDAAGRGAVTIIDAAAAAVGKWFSGWGDDKSSSNTGASTGSSAASSPDYWDDQFTGGRDYGTGE